MVTEPLCPFAVCLRCGARTPARPVVTPECCDVALVISVAVVVADQVEEPTA